MRIISQEPHEQFYALMPTMDMQSFVADKTDQIPEHECPCSHTRILKLRACSPLYRHFRACPTFDVPGHNTSTARNERRPVHSAWNMGQKWCILPFRNCVDGIANGFRIRLMDAHAKFPRIGEVLVLNHRKVHIQKEGHLVNELQIGRA